MIPDWLIYFFVFVALFLSLGLWCPQCAWHLLGVLRNLEDELREMERQAAKEDRSRDRMKEAKARLKRIRAIRKNKP
jgi:Na+-translocating ferredoxin:NAD+ oxidoreductase RnfC subunit